MTGYVRRASHAGSWYADSGDVLREQLSDWLSHHGPAPRPGVKAVIAPHAGYSYSGPTAAAAYHTIDPSSIRRVFVLGPSHHVSLRKCSISGAKELETPVGNMQVDGHTRDELLRTGMFDVTSQRIDEDEHSIEMHLPYIAMILNRNRDAMIVPIMVGHLNTGSAAQYAQVLQPFFEDSESLFVISSDFCHWGKRFQYTPYDASKFSRICEYIKWLDHQGMKLIENHELTGFVIYLDTYENTICGRNPITLLLALINYSRQHFSTKFVHYAQSSEAESMKDSSVSYAAAVIQNIDIASTGDDVPAAVSSEFKSVP